MTIDVYKIGVSLAFQTNGQQVLSLLMRDLARVNTSTDLLNRNIKLVAGSLSLMGGAAVLKGLWSVIEASKDLNKELERTKQLGGDFAANIANTRSAAFATTLAVPTSFASENVRLSREIGVTIGKPEAADAILSEASKAGYVASHFTGEKQEDIIKNLARVADLRGQIYSQGSDGKEHVDPVKLMAELDAAAKALILGGGFIKSNDLLQFARQGGAAIKGQSPEAFYATGVEAAIAMGASKTGTAETGLFQQMIGGTMTKKIAEHMTEAGLLHDGDWTSGKSGGVVVKPGVAARFEPMMRDPVAWLTTGEGGAAMKQYAAKNGIDTMMAIFQLFGRQTVQRLVSEITTNAPQFARAREIYGNIPGYGAQYAELQKNSLDTNIIALSSAWKTLAEALGEAGTPAAIIILQDLSGAVRTISAGAAAHPEVAVWLLDVTGALGALAAVGGGITLVAAAIGPIAAGLATLADAATAIASAPAGLLLITGLIAKIGSDNESPESRAALDKLRRERGSGGMPSVDDGYGPDGRPLPQNQSFRRPPPANANGGSAMPIAVHVTNGRDLARGTASYMGHQADLPNTGPNRFDGRMGRAFPSNTVAA